MFHKLPFKVYLELHFFAKLRVKLFSYKNDGFLNLESE